MPGAMERWPFTKWLIDESRYSGFLLQLSIFFPDKVKAHLR